MKERNKLVVIEIICALLIVLGIVLIIYNAFRMFGEGLGRQYILNLNNSNRNIVESYLVESEGYQAKQSIENAKEIQYYLNFNDAEYTIYYNDGTEHKIYDDGLFDLMEYIKKKGYSLAQKYMTIEFLLVIGTIMLYEFKSKIGQEIDEIDNKNEI